MKYIGIDYGKKRIGIALSDDEGILAFPHIVLENKEGVIERIKEICVKNNISAIVIGESRNFKGKPNSIMEDSVTFAKKLKEETLLPIFFEPEFLTSREAMHIQGESHLIDASAASLILRSFLDKKRQSPIELLDKNAI
ncbi:MAG: Holliday junction resolvase RuvX [Candidatus Pacebacteria bacterium]|nr:Holliday junction resolvase RuvX [Candidatus Paceibacterota bacterium]